MQGSDQNGPAVVPEMLQHIATELRIAERLNINWNNITPEAVGLYIGVLAGVNAVATTIADKNDRSTPTYADYIAAVWSFCMFPPNKRPVVDRYWSTISGAFYSSSVRDKLKAAVGPRTIALANELHGKSLVEYLEGYASTTLQINDLEALQKEYFQTVFDPTKLK